MNKLQVLIIEDDKDTASFFSFVLSLVGFECDVVFTAKEALSRLSVVEPDIILLDMRLGSDISGEDILHQIRTNPRFDKTHVIVITAYPSMAEPITNLADLILIKPVEVEQLQSLAERLGTYQNPPTRTHYHDPVTELYNLTFFNLRLEHAIERAQLRQDFLFAAFIFSIDLVGENKDLVEYGVMRAILKEVARRLRLIIRPTDTVAHLGGGKFASLHEELKDPEDVPIIIGRIQEKLAKTYYIKDRTYDLTLNLGAVIYDRRYESIDAILEAAEHAMVLAMQNGEKSQKVVPAYGRKVE